MNNVFRKEFRSDYCGLCFETGEVACQADGAILVRSNEGDVLLTTITCNRNGREKNYGFFPLCVSYQEKYAAVGKIPPYSVKREGKLTDREILISRLVDRGIRPVFDKGNLSEVNVNITLFSANNNLVVERFACFSTSLALLISNVGFNIPVSEVVVWYSDGKWELVDKELSDKSTKLVVCGTKDHIVMIEGSCNEIADEVLLEGINVAMLHIKEQCLFQEEFLNEYNSNFGISRVDSKENVSIHSDEGLTRSLYSVYSQSIESKKDRDIAISNIVEQYVSNNKDNDGTDFVVKESKKEALLNVLKDGKRIDGRKLTDVRGISSSIDFLPHVHGSALFTRGETQALVSLTLGDRRNEQMQDGVLSSSYVDFILHYNFPSYATGETSQNRGISRREIGHGNLACNGIKPILPANNNFVIRIVSDILSSNGSSSMATVCGSSLALMDAGISIKSHVAGIAMGLIFKSNEEFFILSDISADEDDLGDMDFKVVGTSGGITAIQLDVKKLGLNIDVLKVALSQSREGLNFILKEMSKTIDTPRQEVKEFIPHYGVMNIDREMIGRVIGVGGSVIQKLQKDTDSTISINEKKDCGEVRIFASNKQMLDEVKKRINDLITIPDVDTIYDGTVKEVFEDKAFVEFMPGKVGLLRVAEVDHVQIDNLLNILNKGDKIEVKIVRVLDHGKYLLSHKVLIPQTSQDGVSVNKDSMRSSRSSGIPDNI